MSVDVCPSCGARVPDGAEQCTLCGYTVESGSSAESRDDTGSVDAGNGTPGGLDVGGEDLEEHECPVCGWENPSGARFCNQCGSRFGADQPDEELTARPIEDSVDLPSTPTPTPSREEPSGGSGDALPASYVVAVIGVGVLLVLGLWGVTMWSKGGGSGGGGAPQQQSAVAPNQGGQTGSLRDEQSADSDLPPQVADQVDKIRRQISAESDSSEKNDLRRKLAGLYTQAGRYDMAGQVQEKIASVTNTASAWADAGNLYYDWMMERQGQERIRYAKRAIAAYQEALDLDPENLDVRTDMAVAYLYHPEQPMKAIEHTNRVLKADPTHVQANFNKGMMLLRINRNQQAADQFQKVLRLSESGSPIYQRAKKALQAARQQGQ